jgi:hypothetical protein
VDDPVSELRESLIVLRVVEDERLWAPWVSSVRLDQNEPINKWTVCPQSQLKHVQLELAVEHEAVVHLGEKGLHHHARCARDIPRCRCFDDEGDVWFARRQVEGHGHAVLAHNLTIGIALCCMRHAWQTLLRMGIILDMNKLLTIDPNSECASKWQQPGSPGCASSAKVALDDHQVVSQYPWLDVSLWANDFKLHMGETNRSMQNAAADWGNEVQNIHLRRNLDSTGVCVKHAEWRLGIEA